MTLGGFCTLSCLISHPSGASSVPCPHPAPTLDVISENMGVHLIASSQDMEPKILGYAIALVAGGAVVGFFVGNHFAKRRLNHKIKLDCPKVADACDIEDIGEKKSFCRCWKSEKFPYCDGAHNKHNEQTGDNVGPITVKGKPAASQ